MAYAMNQALLAFSRDADPATLLEFHRNVDLQEATNNNSVSVYDWPKTAYEERPDGGLVLLQLDGEDFYYDPTVNSRLDTVKEMAQNPFYGDNHPVYHVDLTSKRIYVPEGSNVKARIITEPGRIFHDTSINEPSDVAYANLFYGDTNSISEVTDESATASSDTYIDLANSYLLYGSVEVSDSSGSPTYRENVDYVIDYITGRLKTLSTGSISDASSLTVDYNYYSSVSPYLPISEAFSQRMSQLAFAEMIKMIQNPQTRQLIMNDTMTGTQAIEQAQVAQQQRQQAEE